MPAYAPADGAPARCRPSLASRTRACHRRHCASLQHFAAGAAPMLAVRSLTRQLTGPPPTATSGLGTGESQAGSTVAGAERRVAVVDRPQPSVVAASAVAAPPVAAAEEPAPAVPPAAPPTQEAAEAGRRDPAEGDLAERAA